MARPEDHEPSVATQRVAPDWLIVTATVSENVRRLASALAGRPIVDWADGSQGESVARPGPGQTALVVARIDDLGRGFVDWLESISEAGVRVGLVLGDTDADDRFGVIKALCVSELVPATTVRVFSSAYPEGVLGLAPDCLVPDAKVTPEVLGDPADVLLLSGHSSVWDVLASRHAILCGRQGAAPQSAEAAVLPCFHGAGCFRQRQFGRDAESPEGLVRIEDLRARLLVMSGCQMLRLAGSHDAVRHGVVFRAWQSETLSIIASVGLVPSAVGGDALLLGLVGDGRPLGDVVAAVNEVRRESAGAGSRLGPFVLFGNPCTVVRGLQPSRATIHHDTRGVTVDVPTDLSSRADGSVNCFDVPDPRRYVVLRDVPAGVWCHGGLTPDGRGYLWVRAHDEAASSRVTSFRLDLTDEDPWMPQRAAWHATMAALPGWIVMLEVYRRLAPDEDSARLFVDWLRMLPTAMDMLAAASASIVPIARLSVEAGSRDAIAHRCDDQAASICAGLLDCAVEAARLGGVTALIEAQGREIGGESCGPLGPCSCGSGRVWARGSSIGDGKIRERIEQVCDACGALNVGDGRGIVMVASDRRATRGRDLQYTLRCAAPALTRVQLAWCAWLEPWLKDGRVVNAETHVHATGAGACKEWTIGLPIDLSTPPGMHRLAVVAIANGALTLARRPIQVL
jgi:hypothetical protein